MAEERRVAVHPGKAFAEMREKGHARHNIWSKIQEVEAIGVHDVVKEIGKRGAEAAGKVVEEEWVPIRGGLGAIGVDDARSRMPRRLSPHLAPP